MSKSEPTSSHRAREYSPVLGLRCPVCKITLRWERGRGCCRCRAETVSLRGGLVPDFLGGADSAAEAIWAWPKGFLHLAGPWLETLGAGKPLPPEAWAELQGTNLGEAKSGLNPLGKAVAYHLGEYRVQGVNEQFLPPRFLDSLTPESRVVDIGCGAGQTLQRLRPYGPSEFVGVDADLSALALGCLMDEGSAQPIRFVRGSAETLPFDDSQFTQAICRVAINYMHQGRALREMVRVLRPGGLLCLRVEGPGFDWRLARAAPNGRALVCRLRDAAVGITLALTGWQPAPGGRFSGGRAFGTVRRFKTLLAQAGCEVVEWEPAGLQGSLLVGFNMLAKR